MLLPIVFECGGSPIWKIRITAVRAIRALVPRDLYILFISGICTNVKLPLEQNSLHGSLLQVCASYFNYVALVIRREKYLHVLHFQSIIFKVKPRKFIYNETFTCTSNCEENVDNPDRQIARLSVALQ